MVNLRFDLERAKAGDPVQWKDAGAIPVTFIGTHAGGIVIQEGVHGYIRVEQHELCMAPKKIAVRYRVGAFKTSTSVQPILFATESTALHFANKPDFVQWITEWQTAEVPQPDLTDKET